MALIKTYISNLVRTTPFWNNLHQVRSKLKDWKAKQFKVLGEIKPKAHKREVNSATVTYVSWRRTLIIITLFKIKGLNRIGKIG